MIIVVSVVSVVNGKLVPVTHAGPALFRSAGKWYKERIPLSPAQYSFPFFPSAVILFTRELAYVVVLASLHTLGGTRKKGQTYLL